MAKMKFYNGTFAFASNIGKVRTNNEDRAIVLCNASNETLLLVCDGMGGANKGDVASQMAVDIVSNEFRKKKGYRTKGANHHWLLSVIRKANAAIYERAEEDPMAHGMGTTLVAALLTGTQLHLANLGDSRCYVDDGTKLTQITEDQTYVGYLVRCGQITPEEAKSHPDRHVLMNALGIFPSVSLSIKTFPYTGEKILCCTDGLYNQVSEESIHTILRTDERADQKVNSLIAEANARGGSDNSGVAYWEIIENDDSDR